MIMTTIIVVYLLTVLPLRVRCHVDFFAVMSIIFGYNVRQNTTYAVKSQSFEACPPLLTAGTEKKCNAHANSSPICSPHRA